MLAFVSPLKPTCFFFFLVSMMVALNTCCAFKLRSDLPMSVAHLYVELYTILNLFSVIRY